MVVLNQDTFDVVNAPVRYIPSFGIICVSSLENGLPLKFLLVQRANTYEFLEFVRGKYDETDYATLETMFAKMSYEEKTRIYHFDIQDLRKYFAYLDIDNKLLSPLVSAKFNTLKQDKQLFNRLVNTRSNNNDTGWEFPKGRKNSKQECPRMCALREFEEETGISQKMITLLQFDPFSETFTGSNAKVYRTTYYFAMCHNNIAEEDTHINVCDQNQTREVKQIAWLTSNEAITLLGRKKNISHIVTEFEQTIMRSIPIIHERNNKLKDFGVCKRSEYNNDNYLTAYQCA